jgi:uncharacterized repeat protein (TIGR02543 family)
MKANIKFNKPTFFMKLPTKLFTVFSLFTAISFQSFSADPYLLKLDDVTFNESTGSITNYNNFSEKDIIIPGSFNINGTEVNVKSIASFSFVYKSLTSVVISEGVTSIDSHAFYGNSISSLSLPESMKTIDEYAFNLNSLTTVTFPGGVNKIGKLAFAHNKLSSITLPATITEISGGAFNSNLITEVNGEPSSGIIYGRIDNGSVDNSVIISYGGESDVIDFIPSTVNTIDENAFFNNSITSVVIPENITDIGALAFGENNLTQINLPTGIMSVEIMAFAHNSIESVSIPESLTNIEGGAFNDNLISEVNGNSSDGIFYKRNIDGSTDYSEIISYGGGKLVIDFLPETVTIIGDGAFRNSHIIEVIIPSNVTTIEDGAFYENELLSVVIPDKVTYIGPIAFGHNKLTTVSLPEGLLTIDNSAFFFNQLNSVILPTSLIRIGGTALVANNLSSFSLPVHPEFSNDGWKDDLGNKYSNGEEVNDLNLGYSLSGVYIVSYKLNGGEKPENNPKVYHRDQGISEFEPATRAGYVFEGWFDELDNEITSIPPGTERDIVLYAKWGAASLIPEQKYSNLNIYPNPASDKITVEFQPGESFEIYNIYGKLVLRKENNETSQISINGLYDGIYIVKSGNKTSRLIIKR